MIQSRRVAKPYKDGRSFGAKRYQEAIAQSRPDQGGNANINIASLHLDRDAGKGSAIALLEIDEPVSAEQLEAFRTITWINDVRYLHFPALN